MNTCHVNRRRARVRTAFVIALALTAAAKVWAAGLPGEHIISDRWRHAYAQYSGITNPSFINEENYMALRFLFASTLQDFYKHETGLTVPLGLHDAFGFAWMMDGVGPFPAVDKDGNPIPGININDQGNYFALTYARNVWSRLTLGANLSVILQSVPEINDGENPSNATRFGFGGDIGLSWKLLRHPLIGNHLLGMSTSNIFTWISDTEEQYAAAVRFSLLSDFWERQIFYGADFVLKDILAGDSDFPEGIKDMPWELSQKIGGNILRIFKLYMLAGFTPEGFDHYGFAFGVNMPGFFNGRDIEGMIQFVSVPNATDIDVSHITFYARTEFGRHREENYARKMARLGALGPNLLYNQALELYYRGEYFRAYWMFSQIAVEFPDFFRNDMVSYYQGACLEGMDLRVSAVNSYDRTKNEHSRSIAVPLADLGKMRVAYRNGDDSGVDRQFDLLNTLGVPDSIKFHAYYVMGQAMINRGDFTRARQLFTQIPDNHPDYVFAFHSAAVANMMNDNIQGAIADLEFVVQITPNNRSQEEVINRSYVFLGLLFYEDLNAEGALARAVTALRMVPRNSYYYFDAQLGLGWTALKAQQWGDCIAVGQELSRNAPNPIMQSEGDLIQAYAHSQQRNHAQAVTILDGAVRRLNDYSRPSDADLQRNRSAYNSARSEYERMGNRIDELGQARQSGIVQTSIDSLSTPQTRAKATIDQHLKFGDEFARNTLFARGYDQVKEDIDYALARFARYAGPGRRGGGGGAGGDGAIDAIDDELERLRRELEGN